MVLRKHLTFIIVFLFDNYNIIFYYNLLTILTLSFIGRKRRRVFTGNINKINNIDKNNGIRLARKPVFYCRRQKMGEKRVGQLY